MILDYAKTARFKCETLRTDDDIYDVWSDFVLTGEQVTNFTPRQIDRHANKDGKLFKRM